MKTFIVLIRNTETGLQRSVTMHGCSASEIRERATAAIKLNDMIEEIRWTD